MLYCKNNEPFLTSELFQNPSSEYKATPFWAWNGKITENELTRQIEIFKQMGFGAVHIHSRTGLENEYLSDEFFDKVRHCAMIAQKNNMLTWLYDEDRWPSGFGGGFVTENPKYSQRRLVFTVNSALENEKLLCVYDIITDKDGFLLSYKKITEDTVPCGTKWYGFQVVQKPNSRYNNQTYIDVLQKEAVSRFVELTHEKYKKAVGDKFGTLIPAIFTDEPEFSEKTVLKTSLFPNDVTLAWTENLPNLYQMRYNSDIFDTLPEIIFEKQNCEPSVHRLRYHDITAEIFAASYCDTIGEWCRKNNIAFTGHLMEEDSLYGQTAFVGEAMRSYRAFDIPGVDMLCKRHELTTLKQAQSVAHQLKREGVLSELYGVTGWDTDFREYKHHGDWQCALGVTVRVPHLSWYTFGGEAKRDYPATFSFHSSWHREYSFLENHYSRLNTALTRGKPCTNVAVIHPIESFWLFFGANDKTGVIREGLEEQFKNVTQWLVEGGVDFDFISEALLPGLVAEPSCSLQVGFMKYDAVLVPSCVELRETTVNILSAFREKGGHLIFAGNPPKYCDGSVSCKGIELYKKSEQIGFTKGEILTSLEKHKKVFVRYFDERPSTDVIFNLREDNDCQWLFLCYDRQLMTKNRDKAFLYRVGVKGDWTPILYNTLDGSTEFFGAEYINGKTELVIKMQGSSSYLFKLTKGRTDFKPTEKKYFTEKIVFAENEVEYTLDEKNVLLLDLAKYKLNGEDFSNEEQLLRLDSACRERLGYEPRDNRMAQPWKVKDDEKNRELALEFTFESEIEYKGSFLALEQIENVKEILFNNIPLDLSCSVQFFDISLSKIDLPRIIKGENKLLVTYFYGKKTNIENMYIFGDFAVKLIGRKKLVTALPEKIVFGDLTQQGFSFYGGSINYFVPFDTKTGDIIVCIPKMKGITARIFIDDGKTGLVFNPPYEAEFHGLEQGKHICKIKLYLHRYNMLGAVHNSNEFEFGDSPASFRSEGNHFSYEYCLKPTGLMAAVKIKELFSEVQSYET